MKPSAAERNACCEHINIGTYTTEVITKSSVVAVIADRAACSSTIY